MGVHEKDLSTVTFRKFIIDLFSDERDGISIKPVVAFLGAISLCVGLILTPFLPDGCKLNDNIINAVMIITCVGLGADTWDKFSVKGKQSNTVQPTEEEPKS